MNIFSVKITDGMCLWASISETIICFNYNFFALNRSQDTQTCQAAGTRPVGILTIHTRLKTVTTSYDTDRPVREKIPNRLPGLSEGTDNAKTSGVSELRDRPGEGSSG